MARAITTVRATVEIATQAPDMPNTTTVAAASAMPTRAAAMAEKGLTVTRVAAMVEGPATVSLVRRRPVDVIGRQI
jgi:hypothetical protein